MEKKPMKPIFDNIPQLLMINSPQTANNSDILSSFLSHKLHFHYSLNSAKPRYRNITKGNGNNKNYKNPSKFKLS